MAHGLTADEYREHLEMSRRKRLAIIPDTQMNRYSIEAMEIFEDTMDRLSRGLGSFDDETDTMIRRQAAAALKWGVLP